MFPYLNVNIENLDPDKKYHVALQFYPVDTFRYKYVNKKWVRAGNAERFIETRTFYHCDSPQRGIYWMSRVQTFQKLKLTNNTLDENGHVILNSMQKYVPAVAVVPILGVKIDWDHCRLFYFPKTSFMAVTAYQNEDITQLKTDSNPFAKGFREAGHGRLRKKNVASNKDATASEALPDEDVSCLSLESKYCIN